MKPTSASTPRETVPVVEERLRLGKDIDEVGAVRVRVETDVTQAECELSGTQDEIEVRRVAVNAVVDARREPWLEDGAIVVPVYEEIVERRLVLKEEIRLVRRRTTVHERRTVPLRRERAVVERRQPDGSWQPVEPMDGGGRGPADPAFDVPNRHRSDS